MPPEIVDLNDYQLKDWPSTPEGETRQLEETLLHYKTLFAHPLVEGITWWDMSDGHWLNAPAGLLRRDGSSKPAFHELLKLIKGEWWVSPTKLMTDHHGKMQFHGCFGDYEVMFEGIRKSFSVTQGNASAVKVQV
jgi:hypothetical protein